jgi:hypothetical protein
LCVAAALSVDTASAASPSVSSITPPGGKRGTEVEVRIAGSNLSDDPQLVMYDPGIEVKEIGPTTDKNGKVVSTGSVTAKLVIANDCPLGLRAFRIRTASGITSSLVLFSVGSMDEVAEVEPNNAIDTAQALPLNSTVNGRCDNEDVEYYAVELKKGQPLAAEVEGLRLGRGPFDPYLVIYDSNNKELARSDDAALAWYDAVATIVAPADGKYYVMLRESTFGGGSAPYRIHIGSFPRPTAVIPAGGKPGSKMEVTYLGDAGGNWKQTITVPAKPVFYSTFQSGDQKGTALFPTNNRGTAPSPMIFRINDLENFFESEPNEDAATQKALSVPAAFNGIIEKPGDVDTFVFSGKKGQSFDVRVHARSVRSPLDSVLTVRRVKGNAMVGTNDDSGSPDSYLRVNCGADEDYSIEVKDMLGEGGPNYVYRVEVTPIEPTVALSVQEKVLYADTVVSVPAGNRGAAVLLVSRKDFAGDLNLKVLGLPPGMKFEAPTIAAGQTMVPLLLSADDKAKPASGVLDVQAVSTDPAKPASGHLSQISGLVRINQRNVYEHAIQRFSSAIVGKAPYKIEVATPKVPLVRSGTMDLKVRAIREPGFTAPINIRLLYAPNGTAGAVSAQIPEGQNEGTLLVSAGPTAEIREWQIVVLGSASVEGGTVEVASPFVKLQVGEPYFDLAFKANSVPQGGELKYVVQATNNIEFKGKAKLQLIGLPNEATCEPIEISQDSTEAVFTVKTTGNTPQGRHKAVMCNLVVVLNGEPINHTLGPAEIRVDPPVRTRPKAVGAAEAVSQAPAGGAAKTPPTANTGNNK